MIAIAWQPDPVDHTSMVNAEFERVYRDFSDSVYRSAFRVLGNAQDAEDILQTVFLRFIRRDTSLGQVENPATYLRRAAVNAAVDLLRTRKVRTASIEDLTVEPSRAASQELSERLRGALSKIDPKWAEIFLLRYIEGYGNKEISRMLEISQTSVAVTLFRARRKMQEAL